MITEPAPLTRRPVARPADGGEPRPLLRVPCGGEPWLLVRRAGAGDRAALEAMFQRCSPATVYRRFHGQVRAFPRAYLDEALAGDDVHYAVVAARGPDVVALASCRAWDRHGEAGSPGEGRCPGGAGSPGVAGCPAEAELGILIEDAWQRRRLGGLLLGSLVAHAAADGIGVLHAQMLTEQDWIIKMLAPYGSCMSAFSRGVREVTLTWRRGPLAGALAAQPCRWADTGQAEFW